MDKQILQLQKQLQKVLAQINEHKDNYSADFDYGNIDKFLEFASKGAHATNTQDAARQLFSALGEINNMVNNLDANLPDLTQKETSNDKTTGNDIENN